MSSIFLAIVTLMVPVFAHAVADNVAPQAPTISRWQEYNLRSEELFYGVYLNGAKVGFMRSTTTLHKDRVEFDSELHAAVAGMGKVSEFDLRDHRAFDLRDGRLLSVGFEQQAATGRVTVRSTVRDGGLVLTVSAGGRTREGTTTLRGNLADHLAYRRLAIKGSVGGAAVASIVDPSVQQTLRVEHRVIETSKRVFGGINTRIVELQTLYPELSIEERSVIDERGRVLESRVGGFFVARLESREVAQRLDYSQDILVASVVKAPTPIRRAATRRQLAVSFYGFSDYSVPQSSRQRVMLGRNEVVKIIIIRDPDLPALPLPAADSVQPQSTPFIQSDAPEIVATARRVIGAVDTTQAAITLLTEYVYEHVQDEYVAAFSNALDTLRSRRGDCTEHSTLFAALSRAIGIPAKVVVGIAYWPTGGGFGWHAWNEVQIGGRWYAVDSTWNQPIADATHIKLAEGGPAQQAQIVMLLGRLEVVSIDP